MSYIVCGLIGAYLILKLRLGIKQSVYQMVATTMLVILIMHIQLRGEGIKTFVDSIKKEWQVALPPTQQEHKVVRYKGFYGNGISYIVLQYDNEKDIDTINKLIKWQVKDSFVKGQLTECFRFLEEWYDITIEERHELRRYRSKLAEEYEYYYMKEKDNISYGILIWFRDEGILHVIDLTY